MQHPEEALHEQREWLRVTLASIGDAVITTDTQGKITFLNPVAQTLTGWNLAEAVGVPLETVFHIVNEETRRPAENPASRALRDGLIVGLANHTLLISRDGSERPIDDSASPIRDIRGNIAGVVLIFRDVTERRKAEQALRESERRFRLMVEGTRDHAIFMLDAQGRITSWNPGAERIKGYKADEIIGKHFSVFYPAEVAASGWPEKELQMAAKEGRFEDEGWRIRKDGSQFWADMVITALYDEHGRLEGFSKITRDLTDRKHAEEQRRQLERTTILAEASADLHRRKDEFLAMLSHELRNPLSPILNAVHLLKLQKEDDPIRQRAVTIIERQAGQLTHLIDDLLEVSRITSGRIKLQRERIDLRGVVNQAVEAVRPLINQRQHSLSVSLPPEPIWLQADPTRLEQVVVNLLTNAAKYTDEKGRIGVTLQPEGSEAVLRVKDTGIGIQPELLPRVFDLFTQAERALDRSQGGLGVGLTIVQRIVELHSGKVGVVSAGLGKGSEFIVRLPLAGPLESPPEPVPVTKPLDRSLRILVVDDNRDMADSVAILLQVNGHQVRTAYSGPAAIQMATEFRPGVVLLDIGLPDLDGYEVARRLRRQPETREARLIAVTGYGQESDRQRATEAGFDYHLVKPVDPDKLQEVLAALIKGTGS